MDPCPNSLNIVEVTLEFAIQGHYSSANLTDLGLKYHPTLLDLIVILLMFGTIVLMVRSAVLLVGSIVPLILMWMIVGMIRS